MKNIERFQEDLITCLDCFGGSDGGISFVRFRVGMEDVAKLADQGDEAALKLCEMFTHTARLIKIFNE